MIARCTATTSSRPPTSSSRHGPSDGVERWEEQSGFSPSTIAAEIAGLTAAAQIATVNRDPLHARLYQATADEFARNIKAWTVTTTGPLRAALLHPRLQDRRPERRDHLQPRQRRASHADQRSIVDAGFLELVRLGVLPAARPGHPRTR